MFYAISTYIQPIEEVERVTPAHREYLKSLFAKGALVVSGPRTPRTGGFLLFQLATRQEVEACIQEDPFLQQGIATYEVIEFQPVLSDSEFKRLFIK